MNAPSYNDIDMNNVYVRVRSEADEMIEVDADERALYTDIYHMRLNRTVEITFVPAFRRDRTNWPPMLPPVNSDTIPVHTVEQARLITAALSEYTVTVFCDSNRLRIPPAQPEQSFRAKPFALKGFFDDSGYVPQHDGVLFLIRQKQFDQFMCELSELADLTVGRTSGYTASELQEYHVIRFLLEKVVCSPHFRKEDAWALENRALLMK
jgi:hypothetical protein